MNVGGDVGASAVSPAHLEWKFSQVFGERAAGEEVQEGKNSSVTLDPYLFSLCHLLFLGF